MTNAPGIERAKELLEAVDRDHRAQVARLEKRVEEVARDRLTIRELLTEAQAK